MERSVLFAWVLGAGKCFDAMVIHPCSYPTPPDTSNRLEQLEKLKAHNTDNAIQIGLGEAPVLIER